MAGASKAHVRIVGNLSALMLNHLRGSECLSYATGMKVRLPTLGIFYYPDLAITCDDRDRPSTEDYVLDPKRILEVLSDSTEAFDRGDKFSDYQTILEFEEYILIHQKTSLVEQFQHQLDRLWVPQIYRTGDKIEFSSIQLSYAIAAVYENIAQLV